MGYASRTGTRRNLDALRAAGWGLVVSATGSHRTEGFALYGLDNGAWTAHQQGTPWDAGRFVALCDLLGVGAAWVVVPDVVAGGRESLRLSESWLPRLEGVASRRLIAVQDGMAPPDVEGLLGPSVGVFVGGTTEYKEGTMAGWGRACRRRGAYLHVGRVNTARRIRLCQDAGADSFDGTSVSRFAVTIGKLEGARRQQHMGSAWNG